MTVYENFVPNTQMIIPRPSLSCGRLVGRVLLSVAMSDSSLCLFSFPMIFLRCYKSGATTTILTIFTIFYICSSLAVARFDWWLYLCKDASLLMPQRASQLSFEAVWNQHLAKQKTHDSSELEETDILHKDLKPDCPVDRLLTGWSRPAKKYHWAQNWRKGERV
jgi:hypothetical protein